MRLARLERLYLRAPIYFVTACTFERRAILAAPVVHEAFRAFAHAGETRGAYIGRYVLMPDHLHAFLALEGDRLPLSAWAKSLKNSLSKVLRASGIAAPHWQNGYFDHVLRAEESASEKWEYVPANPVRAGFVPHPDDWPYADEIFLLEAR